ncbi:VOC family protein [Saccharopolyspora shandongensis]|uniref:VOC family protein n=1 Tax=Saccharopolyspora shandongensis TaxID=418495 RepID=UPI0033DAF9BA
MTIQPIINTPDLDRLLNFYTTLFGAVEKVRIPDGDPTFFIGLQVGDAELGLVIDRDAKAGTTGRVLLSFDVENVDALLDQVEELGGRVQGPPNDMPWGQRVAHVFDPDGNAVNLTQQVRPGGGEG